MNSNRPIAYTYVMTIRRGGHAAPWPTAWMRFRFSFCKSGDWRTEISMLFRSQIWRHINSNERGFISLVCSLAQQRAFTVPKCQNKYNHYKEEVYSFYTPSPRRAPYLIACSIFRLSSFSAILSGTKVTSLSRVFCLSLVVKYFPSWIKWFEHTTIYKSHHSHYMLHWPYS